MTTQSHVDVFVTDYGITYAGPLFKEELRKLGPDLARRKNSKAYKKARARLDRLEAAVNTLAEVYWSANDDLTVTQ